MIWDSLSESWAWKSTWSMDLVLALPWFFLRKVINLARTVLDSKQTMSEEPTELTWAQKPSSNWPNSLMAWSPSLRLAKGVKCLNLVIASLRELK